jgi:hypothetical protein
MYNQKKIFTDTSLDSILENSDLIISNLNLARNTNDYVNDDLHSNKDRAANNQEECLSCDKYYVDFGATQIIDLTNQQNERSINLFNNTKGKLLIQWNTSDDKPFSIYPQTCEIPALKSYSFRVKFQPVSFDL